jgi:imidazolonepropionase-like amidohydrolase
VERGRGGAALPRERRAAELVAGGMPMHEALAPFTSNVARLLRLAHKGRIEAGADADLVALDRDGRVRDVFIGGVQHVADGRATRRGPFEGVGEESTTNSTEPH